MSRKPFLLMSKQRQSKRIKREMAHTHANINAGGNNSKQKNLFCHKETVWPNNENEFKNNNPDSCSLHSHSPPMQQPCTSNENVSVYPNVIDESSLSEVEYETHETPVDANITFPLSDIESETHETPTDAKLRHWALEYQVPHIAITSLLSILRSHKCFDLPADARTLLKTPVNVITRVVKSCPQYQRKVLKKYGTYNEAHLHLKNAAETSNIDSDDEVIIQKRTIKRVYSPEDSDSPDDYSIVKVKKTQPNAAYPIPTKHLLIGTRKNTENFTEVVATNSTVETVQNNIENHTPETRKKEGSENFTEVAATNSTMEIIQNNLENLTPGRFQSKSQPNLTNAAPEDTFTTNTLITGEVEDVIEISHVTNSTNTGSNRCILSKQFAVQHSHLTQVVTDLSEQMNEVNRKLDLLLSRLSLQQINQRDDTFTVPDFLTNLPVKDDTSFCNLNEELKIIHNKQCIMKFLAGIGGRNARSLATNILRRILLDEVAELYSLTGKQMKNSNKKSFLRTEICKIIFQICKKNYDDVTEEHLKEIISDWLNQAKVRIRRRADRQNKASESEASGYNLGSNESF